MLFRSYLPSNYKTNNSISNGQLFMAYTTAWKMIVKLSDGFYHFGLNNNDATISSHAYNTIGNWQYLPPGDTF